jgi:hypothetical protein
MVNAVRLRLYLGHRLTILESAEMWGQIGIHEQDVEEFNQTIAQCDSNGVISYEGWDGVH